MSLVHEYMPTFVDFEREPPVDIETLEDLWAIPWVQRWGAQGDFSHWERGEHHLIGVFSGGGEKVRRRPRARLEDPSIMGSLPRDAPVRPEVKADVEERLDRARQCKPKILEAGAPGACEECGQYKATHYGERNLCCRCHVATGAPPAGWHPECMRAAGREDDLQLPP